MPKSKPKAKATGGHRPKTGNINSQTLTHIQGARRREVSRLAACGYTEPEIAERVGVGVGTVEEDLRVVRETWWAAREKHFAHKLEDEIRQLEQVRAEALRCFYEAANRHGETNQTGYLQSYARLTEQLHALQRLGQPLEAQLEASKERPPVVTLVVQSREEAEACTDEGRFDLERFRRSVLLG